MLLMLIGTIIDAWGWAGLEPSKILGTNSFGHVLLADAAGQVWRIMPEWLHIEIIAPDANAFADLSTDPLFVKDWEMNDLKQLAKTHLGTLGGTQVYSLRIPAGIGGSFSAENLELSDLEALLAVTGQIAEQIKDLPEGAKIDGFQIE